MLPCYFCNDDNVTQLIPRIPFVGGRNMHFSFVFELTHHFFFDDLLLFDSLVFLEK